MTGEIDDSALTDAQLRARKVKPQYGEGPLVKVAYARNQAEAELIAGLLLEEGVPSVIQRNGGFDVPDFLAAGPRDVLVAASGEAIARDVLAELRSDDEIANEATPRQARTGTAPIWVRLLGLVMISVLLAGTVAFVVLAWVD